MLLLNKPLKNSSLSPGFCQEHFSLGFILKQASLINRVTGALSACPRTAVPEYYKNK